MTGVVCLQWVGRCIPYSGVRKRACGFLVVKCHLMRHGVNQNRAAWVLLFAFFVFLRLCVESYLRPTGIRIDKECSEGGMSF